MEEYINILKKYFKESEQQWFDYDTPDFNRYKSLVTSIELEIKRNKDFVTLLQNSNPVDYEEIIQEYLDNEDYIDISLIEYLEENYNLEVTEIMYNSIYQIYDNYYLLKNYNDHYYEKWCYIDNVEEKIDVMDDNEILNILGKEEEEIYINGWECTTNDLQVNPPIVYHYTTEENWEEIQESGELEGYSGTSLGNRSINGIFTSLDSEEYAIGSYGNVCLKLDLPKFKEDFGLAKLELYPEPEVFEKDLRNSLKQYFPNMEYTSLDSSSGISDLTVIVGHPIPIKYIEVYEG
jgi:hypothetical protein